MFILEGWGINWLVMKRFFAEMIFDSSKSTWRKPMNRFISEKVFKDSLTLL